jgi:hypothetical protein
MDGKDIITISNKIYVNFHLFEPYKLKVMNLQYNELKNYEINISYEGNTTIFSTTLKKLDVYTDKEFIFVLLRENEVQNQTSFFLYLY